MKRSLPTLFVSRRCIVRHKDGPKNHALWRMHPERWLEALAGANIAALDSRLQTDFVYRQMPAFSAADRAMIDILAATGDGRLAVIELKADEDIHLPLQVGLLVARGLAPEPRSSRCRYFPGREISAEEGRC